LLGTIQNIERQTAALIQFQQELDESFKISSKENEQQEESAE
jgi:hypothetical protein